MIGVMLMVYSISDKKSPRRGRRAEHQSTDSRRRTRRKNPSQGLGRLHLSSCYFSQAFEHRHFTKHEVLWDACSAIGALRIDAWNVRCPAQIPGTFTNCHDGLTSWPGISDNRRTFLS